MNAIVLYDCLADVSEDIRCTLTRMDALSDADRCTLEALWVRLDELVEQMPAALQEAEQGAAGALQDEIHDLEQDIRDLEKDIAQLGRQLRQAQAGASRRAPSLPSVTS